MKQITIVGAGQAAAQLAVSLRAEGFTGGIRMIGDEPHLPYQRPPLSKKFLMGEAGPDALTLKPRELYDKDGIELLLGDAVTSIDASAKTVTLADGRVLSADCLVLATGTRARQIACPGADLAGVHTLRTIDDCLELQSRLQAGQRLAVVGGGYIGLEVAASATKLGASATVIETVDRLMARVVSPDVSEYFADVHRGHGVDLRLGASVTAFRGTGTVEAVVLGDGSEIAADTVLVGIGAVPNLELAKAAGLAVANGITVDATMCTSAAGVYAIGDCTFHPNPFAGGNVRLESVQNAIDQAHTAAKTICGKSEPYNRVPWFWSDQYDQHLQIAGLSAPGDELIRRQHEAPQQFAVFRLRAGRLAAVEAVNSAKDYMTGRKLLESGGAVRSERLADPAAGLKDLLG